LGFTYSAGSGCIPGRQLAWDEENYYGIFENVRVFSLLYLWAVTDVLNRILKLVEDQPLRPPHGDPLYGVALALGAQAVFLRDWRIATQAYAEAFEKLMELCEEHPERVDKAKLLVEKDLKLPQWAQRSIPEVLDVLSALKDCKKPAEFEECVCSYFIGLKHGANYRFTESMPYLN
jgi:hypothetical protein